MRSMMRPTISSRILLLGGEAAEEEPPASGPGGIGSPIGLLLLLTKAS